jgi:hypothetical protein
LWLALITKGMGGKGRIMTTEQINKMDGKGIQEKMRKEMKTQKALRNGRSRFWDEERERNNILPDAKLRHALKAADWMARDS